MAAVKGKPLYVGSVKNLYLVKASTDKRPGVLRFSYTDDYSVFDYGKMPDSIPGKGAAMATISGWLFERLEDPDSWKSLRGGALFSGIRDKRFTERLSKSAALKRLRKHGMRTHYRGMVDSRGKVVRTSELEEPSSVMEVEAVNIVRPEPIDFGTGKIWNYNRFYSGLNNFLVPLEVIFRFGVPRGSSLLERLSSNPEYAYELGLKNIPGEGAALPRPIFEFSSKLEPSDRFLPLEMALNLSGLENEEYMDLCDTTLLLALFLSHYFKQAGFKLWDGKFEFIKTGELKLGDAITPDELRLTCRGIQISKEPLRQWYKAYDPKFVRTMSRAKVLAKKTDLSLARICKEKLNTVPSRLDGEFLLAVTSMYEGISAAVTGLDLFKPSMPLSKVLTTYKRLRVA